MMTNYNDGRWYGWNGGECPVHPDTVVDVIFNNDSDNNPRGKLHSPYIGCSRFNEAGEASWKSNHIIAFRVVKEYREPREGYAATPLFETARDAKIVYPGCTPIKVREVIE